jgi:hypothetical protein
MRKFILVVLTGIGLMLAVPEFTAASPLSASSGLGAAAQEMGGPQQVRHRRWQRYRYRHYRVYRYRIIRRCWHRRYWSGRRCW